MRCCYRKWSFRGGKAGDFCQGMSTRAASGFENPESGMGPDPQRSFRKCEPFPEIPRQPSDGSPSKCLEQGYGKPLKSARRSFLNFCKRMVRVKELPSNCPPCRSPEPEESFWDYLFKFEEKKKLESSSACRVPHRRKDICDPRCNRNVLSFRKSYRASTDPQPKPPPLYPPPKAVACRRLAETGTLRDLKETENLEPRCSEPRPFRVPFEECRPPRRNRKPFSCNRGVATIDVAPPVSTTRGTCGGRSVGEFLAEATIARSSPSNAFRTTLDAHCATSGAKMQIFSRVERLRQLSKATGCGGNSSRSLTARPSLPDKKNHRNMSTAADISSEGIRTPFFD